MPSLHCNSRLTTRHPDRMRRFFFPIPFLCIMSFEVIVLLCCRLMPCLRYRWLKSETVCNNQSISGSFEQQLKVLFQFSLFSFLPFSAVGFLTTSTSAPLLTQRIICESRCSSNERQAGTLSFASFSSLSIRRITLLWAGFT